MKCMPITCSGRVVREAISVMEMELVFVARTAPASALASMSPKILNLRSRFSVAASTTSTEPAIASIDVEVETRPSTIAFSSAVIVPFLIWRSRFSAMVSRPFVSASSVTSTIITSNPACAKTCAIPFPICPAPITAMRSGIVL